jgi:hypothetical protein
VSEEPATVEHCPHCEAQVDQLVALLRGMVNELVSPAVEFKFERMKGLVVAARLVLKEYA